MRGVVLCDVVETQACASYVRDACRAQHGNIVLIQDMALFQGSLALAQGVREDHTFGVRQGEGAELHGAGSARKTATAWARMLTAISAGVTASMSMPTGP